MEGIASKEYCAVITFVVKLGELGPLRYGEYFRDQRFIYQTNDEENTNSVAAVVPQGSLLGPILWNKMYEKLFCPQLRIGCTILGFVNDIVIVLVAKEVVEIDDKVNFAIL